MVVRYRRVIAHACSHSVVRGSSIQNVTEVETILPTRPHADECRPVVTFTGKVLANRPRDEKASTAAPSRLAHFASVRTL